MSWSAKSAEKLQKLLKSNTDLIGWFKVVKHNNILTETNIFPDQEDTAKQHGACSSTARDVRTIGVHYVFLRNSMYDFKTNLYVVHLKIHRSLKFSKPLETNFCPNARLKCLTVKLLNHSKSSKCQALKILQTMFLEWHLTIWTLFPYRNSGSTSAEKVCNLNFLQKARFIWFGCMLNFAWHLTDFITVRIYWKLTSLPVSILTLFSFTFHFLVSPRRLPTSPRQWMCSVGITEQEDY